MKIIFFGLGSIGNRHARILADNYNHDLFAYRTNKGQGKNPLAIKEVYTWNEVERISPDVAFITNPTFLHIDTAIRCARLNMKLFIEKPIDSSARGLSLLLNEVSKRKIVTYVAYNLRFHPVIGFLKERLRSKKIYHVSIYNSSYLPGWRLHQDHLKSYSAHAAKGGGVILDLSHEFDYIEYLFGNIDGIRGSYGRASDVTKDSEDFMDAVISTKQTEVNLHQNFLSLNKERTIKIDCKDEFVTADLVNWQIKITGKGGSTVKRYDSDANRLYRRQLEYFFDNLNNIRMMNNLNEASILFKKILEFKRRENEVISGSSGKRRLQGSAR